MKRYWRSRSLYWRNFAPFPSLNKYVLRILCDWFWHVGVLAEVFRAKWSRPRQHQWRQDGAEGRVNNLQEDISPRAWSKDTLHPVCFQQQLSSNRIPHKLKCVHIFMIKDKNDRNTCIVHWMEILLFFCAPRFLHSFWTLHLIPTFLFSLPLWNEKNCPNFCCKKLPNWDLWPKIFDPTSCLWSNHF